MKKTILIAMLGASCLAFAACGVSDLTADTNTKTEQTESSEAADTSETVDEISEKPIKAVYENEFTDQYPDDYEDSLQKQKIVIYEDGSAVLYEMTKYSDAKISTMEMHGAVEQSAEGYRFTLNKTGEESAEMYNIKVENDNLVSVEYHYESSDLSGILGEYKANTEEFGEVTLSVNKDNTILTLEDGTSYVGSIYESSYGWDFYYSNYMDEDAEYLYIDWIVEFGDGTFTYKTYTLAVNEKYAGEYTIIGDLGEISVIVSPEGEASATVTIDGIRYEMIGGFNTDYDNDEVAGFYLSDDNAGISLNLTVEKMDDGELNYYGTIIKQLSAG